MSECKNPIVVVDYGPEPKTGKHQTRVYYPTSKIGDPLEWARQLSIKNEKNHYKTFILPCGKCIDCKQNYSREKSTRCYCESLYSKHSFFITLTYNNKNLPSLDPTLETTMRTQLNNFIRNLKLYNKKITYFAGAELGENFNRPHIHINIFHLDNNDIHYEGIQLKSNMIKKYWPYGLIDIKPFEPGTAQYTAGYTCGQLKKTIFISQSRNLGKQYILEHLDTIVQTGTIPIKGKQVPMTRWGFKILDNLGIYTEGLKKQKDEVMKRKQENQLKVQGITLDQDIEYKRSHKNLVPIKRRKGVDMQ